MSSPLCATIALLLALAVASVSVVSGKSNCMNHPKNGLIVNWRDKGHFTWAITRAIASQVRELYNCAPKNPFDRVSPMKYWPQNEDGTYMLLVDVGFDKRLGGGGHFVHVHVKDGQIIGFLPQRWPTDSLPYSLNGCFVSPCLERPMLSEYEVGEYKPSDCMKKSDPTEALFGYYDDY